jgi:hypothetical protein
MPEITAEVAGFSIGVGSNDLQQLQLIGSHPMLPVAVAAMAQAVLDLSATEPLLDFVFKDAGRYNATMWAFYLHETEGLTPPRLRALCARSRMVSPGRAHALLDLMTHHGLAVVQERRGRTRRYAMTDRFITAWLAYEQAALQAALALDPSLTSRLEPLGPAALRAFGRLRAEACLEALSAPDGGGHAMPLFQLFLHAHAGSHVLRLLLLMSHDGAFPPQVCGPVTIRSLAQRLDVSRIHIRRLFDEAEARGLIRLDDRGLVHFSASAQEQLRFIWAAQFLLIFQSAARTAALAKAV